ncbi:hypothetical protein BLA29_011609, partial [Euroglyphus maynei]
NDNDDDEKNISPSSTNDTNPDESIVRNSVSIKENDPTPTTTTTSGFVTITSHKRNSSNSNSISVNCFVILNRPIERMLIRYEKIPTDFYSCYKYEEDLRSKTAGPQLTSYASLNMFQTLVRFLYHQRFIWSTNDCSASTNNQLNITSISKILSVLTL